MNSPDVVAVLLDASMPPARAGQLLRTARKRRGFRRKQAAAMARISTSDLKAYEQGSAPIPADVCALLADCYGDDLTAVTSTRVSPEIGDSFIVVADQQRPLEHGTPDEILGLYAEIVRKLRGDKPGDALALRAQDVATLAAALDADPATIEQHIMDALGCSREEARALHADLLRRKVVLPIAGLAAAVAALAGMQVAQASNAPSHPVAPAKIEASLAWASTPADTPAPTPKPKVATKRVVKKAAPKQAATPPPAPQAVAPPPPAGVNVSETLHTPEPAVTPPAPAPAPVTEQAKPTTPPSIPEDDTPIGVLPGETPIHPAP